MPSQVIVYAVLAQSVLVAHAARSRQAEAASRRERDIGDHLARDVPDGRVSVATRESQRPGPAVRRRSAPPASSGEPVRSSGPATPEGERPTGVSDPGRPPPATTTAGRGSPWRR